ncbi:MAG: DUF3109 family protein [Massilibacteroides sp.]|nr:DUF3109 family protein [Massilibacteroides sp.]MDD3061829.1 DUF3109 family protein [Massilibacteroides sp.]MDD4114371.1 DUF3109 family protein [Massilibacteroides sp.]MDD4660111.1 DUF3109 family protein [Massilibacteroides sp.]
MIQIKETLVSLDIVEKAFVCDLSQCKGACCVEGDSGAPLEKQEYHLLKKLLPLIWEDLSPEAKTVIEKQGIGYVDEDGEIVTSLVNGRDCVFTFYDENNICKCAIEKAYREGRIDFYKPISCHLYPIRVAKYKTFSALNYNKWKICKAAEILGQKAGVPLYRFLKEPLIRKFGEAWYAELELVAAEWEKQHRDEM